jgi:hypothetical protein
MAVRFSSDASSYSRTVSLGATTQWSVSCWVKISTDRNTFSCAWSLDSGAASDAYVLLTGSDGTTIGVYDESAPRATRALTVGTWYYIGISVNGANGTMVSRSASDTSFTVSTWSTGSASTSISTLRVGRSPNTSEFLNGCVAAFKWWHGATLTQAELETEAWRYLPRRTANIKAWFPFLTAETADYSGQGSTLSGGTGATTEDGPPITWRGGLGKLILPAEGITGDLAATLPALTAAASGDVNASGTLTSALPTLAASASGAVTASGAVATDLPSLTASVSGDVAVSGAQASTLPTLAAAAAGDVSVAGAGAVAFPGLAADLTGAATVEGQAAAVLPPLAVEAVGQVTVSGDASPVLPPLSSSIAGEVVVSGGMAAALPELAASLAGAATVQGGLAAALPGLTASLSGTVPLPRGIRADADGPAVRPAPTPTGPAVRRLVDGPAVSRVVVGSAIGPSLASGPATHGTTPTGPAVRREVDGPKVSRAVTGIGV